MTIIAEIQCRGWEHNRVNSGLIRQIMEAAPETEFKLYGENEQLQNISALLGKTDKALDMEAIDFPVDDTDNDRHSDEYEKVIKSLLDANPPADRIWFLSANKGILIALKEISVHYPDRKFYIVLHSALEYVYYSAHKKNLKDILYETLWSIRNRRRYPRETISMKQCFEGCDADNCRFISFSPCFREALSGKVTDRQLDKITFLHHPFFEPETQSARAEGTGIRIGIYGQALKTQFREIIKEYNRDYDNGKVQFLVKTDAGDEVLIQKNVKRLFDHEKVTNEELEKALSGLDYILVPYDSTQYIVTASGIFCDAVSLEVPLIMMDSPYFAFYSRYNVGKVAKSAGEAAGIISELSEDREQRAGFIKGEKKLKETGYNENIRTLKEIMG